MTKAACSANSQLVRLCLFSSSVCVCVRLSVCLWVVRRTKVASSQRGPGRSSPQPPFCATWSGRSCANEREPSHYRKRDFPPLSSARCLSLLFLRPATIVQLGQGGGHIRTDRFKHKHKQRDRDTQTPTHTHASAHSVHVHTCARAHTHTYTHTHVHTHTHTHTHYV